MFNWLRRRFRRRGRITPSQLQALYILTFFLALHSGLPTYINSSFLENFVSNSQVSLIFAAGSFVSLFVLFNLPRLLRHFGIFKVSLSLISLQWITLVTLGLSNSAWLSIIGFITYFFLVISLLYMLDIFVESFSSDEKTGTIRGILLTVLNAATFLSPLIVSFILGEGENYRIIYLTSSIVILPVSFMILRYFRNFKDPVYERIEGRKALSTIFRNKDLFNIFGAQLLLRFFYSWMVIYTPIYLFQHIGFSWAQIGPILTFALLPFVLFQFGLGRIADKYLGEQEITIAGFIILGLAVAALSFYGDPNPFIWAIMLFLTRVGASAVEIMGDSYFFKQVNSSQTALVAMFRMVNPLAYVVGPILLSVVMNLVSPNNIYLVLGMVMLTGVYFAASITDTK